MIGAPTSSANPRTYVSDGPVENRAPSKIVSAGASCQSVSDQKVSASRAPA